MRTEKFLCPSLVYAEIRESTGADDDILSSLDEPNVVLNRYIANILVSLDGVSPVTPTMVKELRIRDKYFILIRSRIFSLGNILYFTHDWGEGMPKEEYAIDLNLFVWDYTQPLPEPTDLNYSDQRILPYDLTANPDIPIELQSGKLIRLNYLDGHGEEFLLKLLPSQRTINSQLMARKISIMDNGAPQKVVNFSIFSSRDMVEIRSKVEKLDPPVEGLIRLTHPATGETLPVSLIQIRDFFFPVKV